MKNITNNEFKTKNTKRSDNMSKENQNYSEGGILYINDKTNLAPLQEKARKSIEFYQNEFFKFTKKTVRDDDAFLFISFLTSYFKTILMNMDIDHNSQEYKQTLKFLENLFEKTYVSFIEQHLVGKK